MKREELIRQTLKALEPDFDPKAYALAHVVNKATVLAEQSPDGVEFFAYVVRVRGNELVGLVRKYRHHVRWQAQLKAKRTQKRPIEIWHKARWFSTKERAHSWVESQSYCNE